MDACFGTNFEVFVKQKYLTKSQACRNENDFKRGGENSSIQYVIHHGWVTENI